MRFTAKLAAALFVSVLSISIGLSINSSLAQGNKEFGLGAPQSVLDLPNSPLRDKIDNLPAHARQNALQWLQDIEFTEYDIPSLDVDEDGGVFFVDSVLPDEVEGTLPLYEPDGLGGLEDQCDGAPTQASGVPIFHSKPNSDNVLFLDLDGGIVPAGTAWGGSGWDTHPYNREGSPDTFTANEIDFMCEIWLRVAADFMPFDLDVTTEDPGTFGPTVGRVLITNSTDKNGVKLPYDTAGGVAYVNVFGRSNYHTYYSPAFVYANRLGTGYPKYVAEAASHEMGHNFGLSHDGEDPGDGAYYRGHGSGPTSWGPIMGVGYYTNMTQFSKGDYPNATQLQDDLAIIANDTGYEPDDHGDTAGTASQLLVSNGTIDDWGLIETPTDVDVFEFQTSGGTVTIDARNAPDSTYSTSRPEVGNLDIRLELRNSSGSLVLADDVDGDAEAYIQTTLGAGTYTLHVSGVGDSVTPYNDYGSLGQYFLLGTVATEPCVISAPFVSVDPSNQTAGGGQQAVFSVEVTANMSGGCSNVVHDLSLSAPAGVSASLGTNQMLLSLNETDTTTLSASSTVDDSHLLTVTVTNSEDSTNASTTFVVDATAPAWIGNVPWSTEPTANGETEIMMAAGTIDDDGSGPYEYYFTCTPNCADSGWQPSTSYTAQGLSSGGTYNFAVMARDQWGNANDPSNTLSATTDGSCTVDAVSVSISPSPQTVYENQTADYNVQVATTSGGQNCAAVTHNLSASGGGASVSLDDSSLSIVPGQSGSTMLHASSATAGDYSLGVTATASGGPSETGNAMLDVDALPDITVNSIDVSLLQFKKNGAYARARIVIGPVMSGATVQGTWSGVVTGSASGLTDGTGAVEFDSPTVGRGTIGRFIFTVTGVSMSGYGYTESVTFDCVERLQAGSINSADCGPVGGNQPPSVSITGPANGASFVEGTTINFTATASDPEDGPADGDLNASIVWSGAISGSGASQSSSTLGVGSHDVTATVTDNDGVSSSDTITVTVTSNNPGQTGTITGNVKNKSQPLSGATVSVAGVTPVSTDASGNYTLLNVPVGSQTVQASHGSCQTKSSTVSVLGGSTHTVNFRLKC